MVDFAGYNKDKKKKAPKSPKTETIKTHRSPPTTSQKPPKKKDKDSFFKDWNEWNTFFKKEVEKKNPVYTYFSHHRKVRNKESRALYTLMCELEKTR